jgi:hypothetical protein
MERVNVALAVAEGDCDSVGDKLIDDVSLALLVRVCVADSLTLAVLLDVSLALGLVLEVGDPVAETVAVCVGVGRR